MTIIVQSRLLIILLTLQANVLRQIVWIILTQHIAPCIIFCRPVRFPLRVDQRQQQSSVITVVQVGFSLRYIFRFYLVFYLLRRQPALRQPLSALFADLAAQQFCFQIVPSLFRRDILTLFTDNRFNFLNIFLIQRWTNFFYPFFSE